jgi:type IV secretion system protein VirB11
MTRAGENTLRLMLAPIERPLADPAVTEIVINRPGEAGVETREGWTWLNLPELTFQRLDAIATLCAAMSQQDVGPERPLCASVLPDGQRVQICRPPAVAAGTLSLTIRLPSSFAPTIAGLAAGGLFSRTEAAGRSAHPLDRELAELHAEKRWEEFFPLAVRAKKRMARPACK